jgi:hypothetical protein
LGPQRAPLNSTTHRSDWDISTINSNNFTKISPVGLGRQSGFLQLSSAIDASHHTHSQEPQPLFSPVERRNYCLLRLYSFSLFALFLFFFFFHKGKKRKRKASSQSVPRSTMSTTTPPALGGARVGNQDARCHLQEGNDAAAPTTSSSDRVKRKGFSPASLSPSSETWSTPPHNYRQGHHHDAAGKSSHRETMGDRATKGTAGTSLHTTQTGTTRHGLRGNNCSHRCRRGSSRRGQLAKADTPGARTKATRAQLRPSTGRNWTRPTGSRRRLHGRRPTSGTSIAEDTAVRQAAGAGDG